MSVETSILARRLALAAGLGVELVKTIPAAQGLEYFAASPVPRNVPLELYRIGDAPMSRRAAPG